MLVPVPALGDVVADPALIDRFVAMVIEVAEAGEYDAFDKNVATGSVGSVIVLDPVHAGKVSANETMTVHDPSPVAVWIA